MRSLLFGVACGLSLTAARPAAAQVVAKADSVALAAAVATAGQRYTSAVELESSLYNGPEYVNYVKPGTIGHQFFLTADPQRGALTYRGASFRDALLNYDLVLDQVVLTYPNQAVTITLPADKVAAFELGGREFVRLTATTDSAAQGELPTGFYEVVLPGPVSLLARHSKRISQTQVQQNLRLEFKQTDKLFARTATASATISGLKDLLALLPAHQTEVQRYARQQRLRFSATQREASARSALRYYYTLR